MKVYVVIPNWNGADMISDALRSLDKQTRTVNTIVVDNGSEDTSVEIIEKKFPGVILIKKDKNYGFAGGVNIGIRYALEQGADAVALYNNDAVADKDWLKHLVKALKSDEKIGIVSCKQLRTDKKHIDSTGDFYSIWGLPFPRGRNQKDEGQYDKTEEIFSAPAGATLYRSEMLKDVGLFDEKFFAYYEDVDISFRARLAGWKILYEPTARVYHHVSATSSKLGTFTRYHSTKNFLMVYFKNMPGVLFWKYLLLVLLQVLRLSIGSFRHKELLAYLQGLGKFIFYLPSVIKDRVRIQKRRIVAPSSIDTTLYHGRPPKIPTLR